MYDIYEEDALTEFAVGFRPYDEEGHPTCQCPCATCCEDATETDYRNEPICRDCAKNCSY